MPPVDPSASTPAPEQTPAPDQVPAPVPEPPKKPGFFARLFGGGKKATAPAVPANFESQTPEPQLDDATDRTMAPPVVPVADDTAAPSGPGEQLPPTLDVPPTTEGPSEPQMGGVPPTLPTEPPVAETPGAEEQDDTTANTPPRQF